MSGQEAGLGARPGPRMASVGALCRRKRRHGVALVRGNPLKLRGFDLTPEEPHPSISGRRRPGFVVLSANLLVAKPRRRPTGGARPASIRR